MNSNNKGPITPNELFQRLLNNDFKEATCHDQNTRIQAQRNILLELILQYEEEIRRAQLIVIEEEKLIELRERLLAELQALRGQRALVDTKITEEIHTLRLTPVQVRDQASWVAQLTQSRGRNNKLRIRIRDLVTYIQKLQVQNQRLEQERRVLQAADMQKRQAGQDWRCRIQTLQKEHLSYEWELKERLRQREERTLREVHTQEQEMHDRNQRRRIQSLSGKRFKASECQSRYVREA